MTDIFEFTANTLQGSLVSFESFRGKVLLIVNTASKCGFTPQYAGLQKLHEDLHQQGLVVLGFPCNQFGGQEPGEGESIVEFCERNYGVTFPMFEKIDVNGNDAHPLFKRLKAEAPGVLGSEAIKWNFTKFLVARDGKVFKRYAPNTSPEALRGDLERLLAT